MSISTEYAAGFFDGEGSVMVRYDRRCDSFILKIAISNTERTVLNDFMERWNGSICDYVPRKSHHSGWSEWYLQGGGAEPFLRAIRPHSRIKAAQIDLALRLLATRQFTPGRGRRLPPEIKAERARIKEELHALKTKGHGLRGAT